MLPCRQLIALRLIIFLAGFFVFAQFSDAQTRRHIKVVVDSQQNEQLGDQSVQGSGAVIIRRGTVNPSGRISANERQTTVQRKSGIFTLVLDGSESILSVATRVPQSQMSYYYNYAIGAGYIERRIVFNDVGTSLRVNASTLPDGQIRLRLTPRISYFSVDRPGAIDFTEAATELIVPNGQPISLGGSTSNVHELTRQILGYRDRTSTNETNLTVTATVQ
jgi:type II/III secretion system protein